MASVPAHLFLGTIVGSCFNFIFLYDAWISIKPVDTIFQLSIQLLVMSGETGDCRNYFYNYLLTGFRKRIFLSYDQMSYYIERKTESVHEHVIREYMSFLFKFKRAFGPKTLKYRLLSMLSLTY